MCFLTFEKEHGMIVFPRQILCVLALVSAMTTTALMATPSRNRGLTMAELEATVGADEAGCETKTVHDCEANDEGASCNAATKDVTGSGANPGSRYPSAPACPSEGKDYAGVPREVCKSDPPENNLECDEGTLDCYLVVSINDSGEIRDKTCGDDGRCSVDAPPKVVVINGIPYFRYTSCRECTVDGPTGHASKKSDDSCI